MWNKTAIHNHHPFCFRLGFLMDIYVSKTQYFLNKYAVSSAIVWFSLIGN